jgi:hypothetical protein
MAADEATIQTMARAEICWMQSDVGRDVAQQRLQAHLPASCRVIRFPTPHMHALWPFLGGDARAIAEPGRYEPARYPFGDRIAASLADCNLADDALFRAYECRVRTDMPDLDALLAADQAAWTAMDARNDVKLADVLGERFRAQRLFLAPTIPGSALLHELGIRLLAIQSSQWKPVAARLVDELDRLMEGHVGQREELPIHKRVATHFQLAWWSEAMTYRWFNNRVSFRDYAIDTIRWAPWRP